MFLNKNNYIIFGILGLIIFGILIFVLLYRGDEEKQDVPEFNFYPPSGTLGIGMKSRYTYERYPGYNDDTDIVLTVTVTFTDEGSIEALNNGWVNKLKLSLEDITDPQELTSVELSSGIDTGTDIVFELTIASTTPNTGVQNKLDTNKIYNVYLHYQITGTSTYIKFTTGLLNTPLDSSHSEWTDTINALNNYLSGTDLENVINNFPSITFEPPDTIYSTNVTLTSVTQDSYITLADGTTREIYVNEDPAYLQIIGTEFKLHPSFDNSNLMYCYLENAVTPGRYLNTEIDDFVGSRSSPDAGKFVLYNADGDPVLPAPIKFDESTLKLTLPRFFLKNSLDDFEIILSVTIVEDQITMRGITYEIYEGYSFTYDSKELNFIIYEKDGENSYVLVYFHDEYNDRLFTSSAKNLFFNNELNQIRVLSSTDASISNSGSGVTPPTQPTYKTINIYRPDDSVPNTDGFLVIVKDSSGVVVQQISLGKNQSFSVDVLNGYTLSTESDSHVKYLGFGTITPVAIDDATRNGPLTDYIIPEDSMQDGDVITIKFGPEYVVDILYYLRDQDNYYKFDQSINSGSGGYIPIELSSVEDADKKTYTQWTNEINNFKETGSEITLDTLEYDYGRTIVSNGNEIQGLFVITSTSQAGSPTSDGYIRLGSGIAVRTSLGTPGSFWVTTTFKVYPNPTHIRLEQVS